MAGLSDAASNALGSLAVTAFVGALIWWVGRRSRRLRKFATQHGLLFSTGDPFRLPYTGFQLFRVGKEKKCANTLWGDWDGMRVMEADYAYSVGGSDGERKRRLSVAVIDARVVLPPVSVRRENLGTKLADRIGFRDLQFESERFNNTFDVKADDREFAYKLIDTGMMEWLLGADGGFNYETGPRGILVYSRQRLRPRKIPAMLNSGLAFAANLPRLVKVEYRRASPLAEFARRTRLAFVEENALGALKTDFQLLRLAAARPMRGEVWGEWEGLLVRAGEYEFQVPGVQPPDDERAVLCVAVTVTRASLPALALTHAQLLPRPTQMRTFAQRLFEKRLKRASERIRQLTEEEARLARAGGSEEELGRVKRRRQRLGHVSSGIALFAGLAPHGTDPWGALVLHVGRADLEDAFRVLGEDGEFARRLLDAAMVRWLLSSGTGFGFEVRGHYVLACCRSPAPQRLPELFLRLKEFTNHIPPQIMSEYARAAESANRRSAQAGWPAGAP